jgi:hypothetical protein
MLAIPGENETFLGRAAAEKGKFDVWVKERYR